MSDDYQEPTSEIPNESSEKEEYTESASDNTSGAVQHTHSEDSESTEIIDAPESEEDAETTDISIMRQTPLLYTYLWSRIILPPGFTLFAEKKERRKSLHFPGPIPAFSFFTF